MTCIEVVDVSIFLNVYEITNISIYSVYLENHRGIQMLAVKVKEYLHIKLPKIAY